jgi:hypothetical protein
VKNVASLAAVAAPIGASQCFGAVEHGNVASDVSPDGIGAGRVGALVSSIGRPCLQMRLPRVQFAAQQIVNVVAVAAICTGSFGQEKRTDDGSVPTAPSTKGGHEKVEPAKHRVTRRSDVMRFRVVDAETEKPVSLARIVIDNGNLAPELGEDSDAVTWPDGRAILVHRFLFWEERRGDQKSERRVLEGPWIHVTAEGYAPRKMPLSDLLEQKGVISGPFNEAVVALHRRQPGSPGLADLAGEYIFGNGFVYQRLEVSLPDRYHFKWNGDVFTNEPHEDDRYESRGRCSVVDGVLRLVPEGPFSSDLRALMGNDFVPVRWGGRRYLIPEKERVAFCSIVNQGDAPKYMRNGPFSFRVGDRRNPPEGRPEVPPEWASFLLPKSITGTITEVLENHVAIIDVGAKDGLKAGMEFVREKNPSFSFTSPIKILFTEADRSFVRMSMPDAGLLPSRSAFQRFFPSTKPLVLGEKLSSRSSGPRQVE